MRLLHFRRTFVEKMFAIHSKVELFKRDEQPLGSYARHYYDLFQLAAQVEVIAMLQSAEYADNQDGLRPDQPAHFEKSYFYPVGMSFAKSDASFRLRSLPRASAPEYEAQCKLLCYGPYPSWAEVQARFLELRDLL